MLIFLKKLSNFLKKLSNFFEKLSNFLVGVLLDFGAS